MCKRTHVRHSRAAIACNILWNWSVYASSVWWPTTRLLNFSDLWCEFCFLSFKITIKNSYFKNSFYFLIQIFSSLYFRSGLSSNSKTFSINVSGHLYLQVEYFSMIQSEDQSSTLTCRTKEPTMLVVIFW